MRASFIAPSSPHLKAYGVPKGDDVAIAKQIVIFIHLAAKTRIGRHFAIR
jgi:hypothetical protein